MKYSRWAFVDKKHQNYSNKYLPKLFLFLNAATQVTHGLLMHSVRACVWKQVNGSMTLSLHAALNQSLTLPFLKVLLVNWWGHSAAFTNFIAFALSISFILFQKIIITENWNADIEQKGEKSCNFYIMLPLFLCDGGKKGSGEFSYKEQ